MDKYLFDENGFVYELDDNKIYNPIDYIAPRNLPLYAKVKFEYMKEHQPEYVLQLLEEETLFEFLEGFSNECNELASHIYEKSKIKDKITEMMVRECLMYQDLT
jgi:hypothetical protein